MKSEAMAKGIPAPGFYTGSVSIPGEDGYVEVLYKIEIGTERPGIEGGLIMALALTRDGEETAVFDGTWLKPPSDGISRTAIASLMKEFN